MFNTLTVASITDCGLKRENNEDAYIMLREHGTFCVADGMGGAAKGEVASRAVIDHLRYAFPMPETPEHTLSFHDRVKLVQQALNKASRWIKNHAEEKKVSGTGTTVITLVFDGDPPQRALILHAGDSRAYRYREDKLEQISKDHSMAEAIGVKSEHFLPAMFRGVITRAVGLTHEVQLEQTPIDVKEDDLFLLCSDGLNRMLPDEKIIQTIKKFEKSDLSALAQELVDLANDAGGLDNTTIILVKVNKEIVTDEE